MTTAKIFQHGGGQAVRLPKAFRFDAKEVLIEKRGDEVVLKAKTNARIGLKTLNDVARYMAETCPDGKNFPDIERPAHEQERDLDLD